MMRTKNDREAVKEYLFFFRNNCWIACRNIFQIMWLYRMWDDFLTEVVDHISWRSIMCGSERPNKRRDPPWISVFASLFQASRIGLKVIEGKWLSESVTASSEALCTWWMAGFTVTGATCRFRIETSFSQGSGIVSLVFQVYLLPSGS